MLVIRDLNLISAQFCTYLLNWDSLSGFGWLLFVLFEQQDSVS